MHVFRDRNGRQWSMSVDVNAAKRAKALAGIDLLNLLSFDEQGNPRGDLLERLSDDPVLLVDTLYAVCKPEADLNHITDEQFGAALVGDAIEEASDALLDEIVDFFPSARRAALGRMLAAGRRLRAAREREVMALVESGELDREVDRALGRLDSSQSREPEPAKPSGKAGSSASAGSGRGTGRRTRNAAGGAA